METPSVVNWHTNERGNITAIVLGRGRKYLRIISLNNGHGIRLDPKVPIGHEKYMRPAEFKGKPYPVKRYARALLRRGKTSGITKSAEAALKGVLK